MDGAPGRKTATGSLIAIWIRPKKKDRKDSGPFALVGKSCEVGGDSRPRLSAGRSPAVLTPSKSVELRSTDSRGRLSPHIDYAAASAVSRRFLTLSWAACTLAACRRTIWATFSGKSPVTAFW